MPAFRPDCSTTSRNGPVVVPGKVVDWRTTRWPARRPSRTKAAAPRTGARSGSLVEVIGVGTHTNSASTSRGRASAGLDDPQPSVERRAQPLVADVVDGRVAGVELRDPGG